MGYLEDSYRNLNPLKTDMYQLTMAQGYFDQGRQDEDVTFYMHWRNPPFNGGYTVAAGLEGVVDFLNNFKFKPEDIAYLRTIEQKGKRLFSDKFLDYLASTDLKLQVDAVPEGTVMTTSGPVLRVRGPLAQAQLVESAILNIVNSSSIVATRAARLTDVSDGRPVADFGLRRAPTLDGSVARASFIGGAVATSDVAAAKQLGIRPTGTMAHAWIMGFKAAIEGYTEAKKAGRPERWISPYHESTDREFYENLVRTAVDKVYPNVSSNEIELVAFKAYLKSMPTNSIMLIDTFEPVQGIKNAIQAAIEMNVPIDGVRLDSGDLYALSWAGRNLLDEAKKTHPDLFGNTKIYATDGLDEARIYELQQRSLKETGKPLPIDVYGVGTELVNPGPLRGGVYKVSANEIIREDFECNISGEGFSVNEKGELTNAKGEVIETVMLGEERIPIKHDMIGTMKVAGTNKLNPALPSEKSSMPGAGLDTLRLRGADGKLIADVIVDTALHSLEDWQKLIKEGQQYVVDTAGTLVDTSAATAADLLLKPIFARGKEGASQYVYDAHGAPPKKPAYAGGPEVTDLKVIQDYAKVQRDILPEQIRRFNDPHPQPILMGQDVVTKRQAIMAEMKPGTATQGALNAQQQPPQQQI